MENGAGKTGSAGKLNVQILRHRVHCLTVCLGPLPPASFYVNASYAVLGGNLTPPLLPQGDRDPDSKQSSAEIF